MNKKILPILFDDELYAKITKLAKEKGLTKSGFIRMLILNYINEMENK